MKPLMAALLVSFSCAAIAADRDESKTVQSKDKCIQVTLPKGWETIEITEMSAAAQDRSIAAKSPDGDRLLVVSDPKRDFHSLKDLAEANINAMKKASGFEDLVVTEPRTVKINGQDALQFGFHATIGKLRLVQICTCIESPTRWNQIKVFAGQSQLGKVQDQIDAINKSFKELPKDQQSKESPKNGP